MREGEAEDDSMSVKSSTHFGEELKYLKRPMVKDTHFSRWRSPLANSRSRIDLVEQHGRSASNSAPSR